MHPVLKKPVKTRQASVRLMLSVHFDAARMAPSRYLVAMWWRLLGKRVRSRGQLAPLLAMSRQAYGFWLLGEPDMQEVITRTAPPIVVLIEGTGKDIAPTLDSISHEGLTALVIGSSEVPTLAAAAQRIDWNSAPWLMPLAPGDILAEGAANAYRAAVADTESCVVYADDDLVDHRNRRVSPHFKPEWNSELFRHFDLVAGACIIKASQQDLVGSSGPDWPTRLTASALTRGKPSHVARVLHHRRSRPLPRIPPALDVSIASTPSVTVIIPTRNRVDLLSACCEGLEKTDYPDLDVIVVDNGSDDPATLDYLNDLPSRYRVLRHPGPFNFSALNNRAADAAAGQLLCLLNNDIEMIEPSWLKKLAVQAQRPEVGAVGAQLLYPDGRIQHAGVVLGVGGGAAHAHRLLRPEAQGYFRRHALPQFVSAVTAACLVVQRDRFMAVGGFDEAAFAVAFNDVDLCMRLNQRGWQSFYEPRACLVHHESVSRGLDRDPIGAARLAGEIAALQLRWKTQEWVDPFHHPQLNRFSEQFVVHL